MKFYSSSKFRDNYYKTHLITQSYFIERLLNKKVPHFCRTQLNQCLTLIFNPISSRDKLVISLLLSRPDFLICALQNYRSITHPIDLVLS